MARKSSADEGPEKKTRTKSTRWSVWQPFFGVAAWRSEHPQPTSKVHQKQ